MGFIPIEQMRAYQRAEEISDTVWRIAIDWPYFVQRSVGLQLVRSVDSIGANLAEGHGRFHAADICKFLYYSRGSLRETLYWIRRAHERQLMSDEHFDHLSEQLEQLSRELNQLINHQKSRKT